jgi:hypothetical protein
VAGSAVTLTRLAFTLPVSRSPVVRSLSVAPPGATTDRPDTADSPLEATASARNPLPLVAVSALTLVLPTPAPRISTAFAPNGDA